METVVLLGCLDTKGDEYAFVRDLLTRAGIKVVVVDTGVLGPPTFTPDIARGEVAAAAGHDIARLAAGSGAVAVDAMATGAAEIVRRQWARGDCDGALALGGTGGTSIAARAFNVLPIGVPKVIVSTAVVTGNAASYVGHSDLVLFPAITDIAGVNRISTPILSNAAAAVIGMVRNRPPEFDASRTAVAASMFGVTTTGVTAARRRLTEMGYEVIVFHQTGVGGQTMERLIEEGHFGGVLDVTTHELVDRLVGGVFRAGDERLTTAGRLGLPQVVSLGALDMVNFHGPETVPDQFAGRRILEHNPAVTVVRTEPDEAAKLGATVAERLSAATGPVSLFLPLRGMSAYGVEGAPFHDPTADAAMFDAIRSSVAANVELVELDLAINDSRFTEAMAERLHSYLESP